VVESAGTAEAEHLLSARGAFKKPKDTLRARLGVRTDMPRQSGLLWPRLALRVGVFDLTLGPNSRSRLAPDSAVG
jgi:hypothetical protein